MEEAKTAVAEARRLNPNLTKGVWHSVLGVAELGLGHYETSIDEYHKALDAGFRIFWVYDNLADALALEGKMEEAKTALAEARRLYPNLTVKLAPNVPHLIEGLRKAGLPDE